MNISGFVNMRSFEAAMIALPKEIKKEVRRSMKEAADMIVAKAKELAPVDEGHLRGRIRSRLASWSTGDKIVYEIVSDATKRVSSAGPYPSFQEFGWMQKNGVRNPGHPYLRPAMRQMRADYQRIMQAAILRAIGKAYWTGSLKMSADMAEVFQHNWDSIRSVGAELGYVN